MLFHQQPTNTALIIKTANNLLAHAAAAEAERVIFSFNENGADVIFSLADGQEEALQFSPDLAEGLKDRLMYLTGINNKKAGGFISSACNGFVCKFSALLIKSDNGSKIILSASNSRPQILGFHELGMADEHFNLIRQAAAGPGLIIISSPQGGGKTTTAYSLLSVLNHEKNNIYALQNFAPINLPNIHQILINKNLSWQQAFNSVARQDADIIFLDEPDDNLDWQKINNLATGKLIIIASDNQEIINNLRPNLYIRQNLVRRLCPDCAFNYSADDQVCQDLKTSFDLDAEALNLELYHAAGCEVCNHQGYTGHLGVFDFSNHDASLLEDAFAKALAGLTTVEEIKNLL